MKYFIISLILLAAAALALTSAILYFTENEPVDYCCNNYACYCAYEKCMCRAYNNCGCVCEHCNSLGPPLPVVPPPPPDYSGKFTLFGPSGYEKMFYVPEPEKGDVLEETINGINRKMLDEYGVEIAMSSVKATTDEQFRFFINCVNAMDVDFDAAYVSASQACAKLIFSGMLNNWNDDDYLYKYWWNGSIIENCSVNNKILFTSGAANWDMFLDAGCVIYNKRLADEYNLDYNNFDIIVQNGLWTVDYFIDITRHITKDLNNDGIFDENDGYAVMLSDGDILNYFLGGFRQSTVIFDYKNLYDMIYDVNSSRTFKCLEKVNRLLYENYNGFIYPETKKDEAVYRDFFKNNQALFNICTVRDIWQYRDMEDEYGILPFPKFDESQERYGSSTGKSGLVACLPTTNTDTARAGFVFNELNREAANAVVPYITDFSLHKNAYRDEGSRYALSVIFENIYYDFGRVYDDNGKGKAAELFAELVRADSNDLLSGFENIRYDAEKHYSDIMDAFFEIYFR